MEYTINGNNKSTAIIFLHGWAGDYNNFRGSVSTLECDCICVNTSFFATEPTCPLTLEDYCQFVRAIIDELRAEYYVERVILVGHSFGGRVAIKLASECYADRIMLIDSAGMKPKRKVKHIYRAIKHKLYKFMHIKSKSLGSPDYRVLSTVMKKTFVNIVNQYLEADAAVITIPTIIYWGKRDKDTPLYMARRLHNLISDSAMIAVDGGHYSYLDNHHHYIAVLRSLAGL